MANHSQNANYFSRYSLYNTLPFLTSAHRAIEMMTNPMWVSVF